MWCICASKSGNSWQSNYIRTQKNTVCWKLQLQQNGTERNGFRDTISRVLCALFHKAAGNSMHTENVHTGHSIQAIHCRNSKSNMLLIIKHSHWSWMLTIRPQLSTTTTAQCGINISCISSKNQLKVLDINTVKSRTKCLLAVKMYLAANAFWKKKAFLYENIKHNCMQFLPLFL